jgi:hypothetical protein
MIPPTLGHAAASPPSEHCANPEGNERLTALTGAVLLAIFTAECLTTLSMGNLLPVHIFLGMLVLGPVALKTGSTLYRLARYYAGSAPYCGPGAGTRQDL